MPATEQTWRNQKTLHLIFGASGLALLLSTLWMFAADHSRSWKQFQKTARRADLQMTRWRKLQFETNQYQNELERLELALLEVQSEAFPADRIEAFKAAVRREADRLGQQELPTFDSLDRRYAALQEAAATAEAARKAVLDATLAVDNLKTKLEDARSKAQQAAAEDAPRLQQEVANLEQQLQQAQTDLQKKTAEKVAAEKNVVPHRQAVMERLRRYVQDAQFNEDRLLQQRKFTSAEYDAKRADLDIALRDGRPEKEIQNVQEAVNVIAAQLADLTLQYQAASEHRKNLQSIVQALTEPETEAAKKLADHRADRERLDKMLEERRSTFFVSYIFPGKKWLELPILDAFNSPLKIDNLWSDGLEENYNFRNVRRFDRCTTCHKSIDKTMPGSAVDPAYDHERTLTFRLEFPEAESDGSDLPSGSAGTDEKTLESELGVRLADGGLIDWDDITISYVVPRSPAAQAEPVSGSTRLLDAVDVRRLALQPQPFSEERQPAGLLAGDIIDAIDGDRVRSAERAAFRLLEAAARREPVEITVRRGLPHPYASHPRLDLFVGSLSPHPVATFACTICHEGQGSATEFKWASHTPDSVLQRKEWVSEYGWFDNHHWIYPMYAKRFQESTCLKCHHDVTELESSPRFREAPAPKVTRGYHAVAKYGCFGCHEINGYDGAKRIGPDLRLEPNYFAAAQQLQADSSYANMTEEEKATVQEVIQHPDRDDARHKLYRLLTEDAKAEQPRFTATAHTSIASLLKDVESPGTLRKVGPSLRYVAGKLDDAFLFDWIRNPRNFRPSTRMPRFFGLWSHLTDEESLHTSQQFEPIEILGIVHYLRDRSQAFTYLEPPSGITPSTTEEKLQRGKIAFEQRGCLACHSHRDFPDVAAYRPAEKIQQGPDLSNIGDKFAPERNPQGRNWLYSWIKQPHRYHVRTVMPDLFLDPQPVKDATGNVIAVVDPADDITEYLMSSRSGWQPAEGTLTELNDDSRQALQALLLEHLKDAFFISAAEKYAERGIPADMERDLKGAEKELIVPVEQYQDANARLSDHQKLAYIGRKTIAKFGCYACHDIPGFEDAKPIGTALADWGRKDPARLAFEHIAQYVEHNHKKAELAHGAASDAGAIPHASPTGAAAESSAEGPRDGDHAPRLPEYYEQQLLSGNRIGFLYQKLLEPRSYDFEKTRNKRYNERLRMPQFPFDEEDREAVMTFILGLVAEPPSAKYVYHPDERTKAIMEGAKVLEKYNCGGCHVLEGERWDLSFTKGTFPGAPESAAFDFTLYHATSGEIEASLKTDYRNRLHGTVEGLPSLDNDGLPMVTDVEGETLYEDEKYSPRNVNYSLLLFAPAVLEGNVYQVQQGALPIRGSDVAHRYPANGGDLTRYLLPRVVQREQALIPTLKGSESWGWLPPPLMNEGIKVQSDWLHDFLLDPFAIRPAVVMRMPRFNMSSDEATRIVNYFAARDDAEFPYTFAARRRTDHLQKKEIEYQQRQKEADPQATGSRFDHAMKVVTNSQYCVQCHIIGDFVPTKEDRGKGPDLTRVYKRLRSEYLRNWIARPTVYLPYTGMPVNIPYDPSQPLFGTTVPQTLYRGNSIEQLDGIVDLLANYDLYSTQHNLVRPLVEAQKPPAEPNAENPAGETGSNPAPATDATGGGGAAP